MICHKTEAQNLNIKLLIAYCNIVHAHDKLPAISKNQILLQPFATNVIISSFHNIIFSLLIFSSDQSALKFTAVKISACVDFIVVLDKNNGIISFFYSRDTFYRCLVTEYRKRAAPAANKTSGADLATNSG